MSSFFRRVSKSKVGTWIMAAILIAILAGFAVSDISNFGSGNIGFGMGGGLLQKVNRDLFKFAMKCSAIELETGEERDVFKSPIDQPDKSSKKGILDTVKLSNGEWATMRAWEALKMRREGAKSMLHNVFNSACGQIHTARTTTFDEIRERAKL